MMLTTTFRKLQSFGRLLTRERPLAGVSRQTLRNLRQARLALHGGQPFAYRTLHGSRFLCIPSCATSVHHYLHRLDDQAELTFCRSWLRRGDVGLDIGANIGCYTATMAAAVGPAGRVIAVEPSPPTLQSLRLLVKSLNLQQVRLEGVCVTDHTGEVEFLMATRGEGETTQAMAHRGDVPATYEQVRVPATTVNELLRQQGPPTPVALVKIDIEGAEPLALAGASDLFRDSDRPLFIIEISRAGLRQFGFSAADVLRWFPAGEFQRYLINREYPLVSRRYPYGSPVALDEEASEADLPYLANLIAIPRQGRLAPRAAALPGLPRESS